MSGVMSPPFKATSNLNVKIKNTIFNILFNLVSLMLILRVTSPISTLFSVKFRNNLQLRILFS